MEEISGSVTSEPKKLSKKLVTTLTVKPPVIDIIEEALPYITDPIDIQLPPLKSMKYKMDLYTPNGLLRDNISRGLFADMSRRHGDIMRTIPSGQWSTMEEIITNYNNMVKRFHMNFNVTADQIEIAVKEMAAAGLILTK